jgi:hypothetical protein
VLQKSKVQRFFNGGYLMRPPADCQLANLETAYTPRQPASGIAETRCRFWRSTVSEAPLLAHSISNTVRCVARFFLVFRSDV